MVRENQASSLQRLPTELRDRIWRYVLGGQIFIVRWQYGIRAHLAPATADPRNGVALLRTCRQIYSETASYPLGLGAIASSSPAAIQSAARRLKSYQRKQLRALRLVFAAVNQSTTAWNYYRPRVPNWDPRRVFSSITRIDIIIHRVSDEQDEQFQFEAQRMLRKITNGLETPRCIVAVRGVPEEKEY